MTVFQIHASLMVYDGTTTRPTPSAIFHLHPLLLLLLQLSGEDRGPTDPEIMYLTQRK